MKMALKFVLSMKSQNEETDYASVLISLRVQAEENSRDASSSDEGQIWLPARDNSAGLCGASEQGGGRCVGGSTPLQIRVSSPSQ